MMPLMILGASWLLLAFELLGIQDLFVQHPWRNLDNIRRGIDEINERERRREQEHRRYDDD